jgi:hypothetical protein
MQCRHKYVESAYSSPENLISGQTSVPNADYAPSPRKLRWVRPCTEFYRLRLGFMAMI